MPLQRRHALVPAAIALVAGAAFAALWIAARTGWARSIVAQQVSEAVGLPATVASLGIGFIPSPTLEIGGLAVAQPPGFGDAPFLEIARVELRLPWRSIFDAAHVDTVAVSDAKARLVTLKDGRSNWSALFPELPAGTAAPEPAAWFLGAIVLERGHIEVRDEAEGSSWQVAGLALDATDVAPATEFPVELKLAALAGPNTVHYAVKGRARLDPDAGRYEASGLEFRGWAGGEPLPLAGAELTGALQRAAYEVASGVARLEAGRFTFGGVPGTFEGSLALGEPALGAAFRVATEPFAPRAPAIIFGRPLPATADPTAFESLQLVAEGTLKDGTLRLEPVSGRLDDTNFEARIVPGDRLVRASLDRIDLNRYVPPAAKTLRKKKATLEAAVAQLAAFDLDAEITIGQARVSGATIRDAKIRVERSGGHSP
jgi:AsmA-like protein